MSDENATPLEDTVDVSAPEEGHAQTQEQIDYEKRYNDLRPEFDRTSQQLSEYEQTIQALQDPDPEVRAAALAAFGLELEDEEADETPEYEDPYETLAQRVERLETEKQQAQQHAEEQAHQDAVSDFIISEIEKIQDETGKEFSDFEWKILGREAQDLQEQSNARAPMVREAYEALAGYNDQQLSSAFKGKRPSGRPPQGQSASKQPDLSTSEGRRNAIADALAASEMD